MVTPGTTLIGTIKGQAIEFQQRLPFYDGAQVVVDIHPPQPRPTPPQTSKFRDLLPKHRCGNAMASLRREEFYADAR